MRTLATLACSIFAAAALAASAGAADPNGVLSVDEGRGAVTLDIRGVVLGRLANGSIRVTDLTPRDRFVEVVTGRKMVEPERVGPRTVVYRGLGLRFRMWGGRYRIVVRGVGIVVSAHGRGVVTLDGEAKPDDGATGLFSVDGADCSLEPTLCAPLPTEPERFVLGAPEPEKPEEARTG
jgi:hypothetical protein